MLSQLYVAGIIIRNYAWHNTTNEPAMNNAVMLSEINATYSPSIVRWHMTYVENVMSNGCMVTKVIINVIVNELF